MTTSISPMLRPSPAPSRTFFSTIGTSSLGLFLLALPTISKPFRIPHFDSRLLYGDQLLIQTAQRIVCALRESDTVARLGGDEFVVLLSELDASRTGAAVQAVSMAEKISFQLAQPYDLVLPASLQDPLHWAESSASVGWALFDGSDADLDAVLHQADQAMYQIKRAGR